MKIVCSRLTPCTVKKTFASARKANSHLLVQVKENQSGLLQEISQASVKNVPLVHWHIHIVHEPAPRLLIYASILPNLSLSPPFGSMHGRAMKPPMSTNTDAMKAAPVLEETRWNGLIASIIKVSRSPLTGRGKDGMRTRREEISFYVCSAPLSAKTSAYAIRSHWAIENRNHYVRDVSMLEDASRIRINPSIFARARSFALNILRANGEKNIADALWCNALDFKRPLAYRFT